MEERPNIAIEDIRGKVDNEPLNDVEAVFVEAIHSFMSELNPPEERLTMSASDLLYGSVHARRSYSSHERLMVQAAMRHDHACPESIHDFALFQPYILGGKVYINYKIFTMGDVRILLKKRLQQRKITEEQYKTYLDGLDNPYFVIEMEEVDDLNKPAFDDARSMRTQPNANMENEDHRGLDYYDVMWYEDRPHAVLGCKIHKDAVELVIPGHYAKVGDSVFINGFGEVDRTFSIISTDYHAVYIQRDKMWDDVEELVLPEIIVRHKNRRMCVDHRDGIYDGPDELVA